MSEWISVETRLPENGQNVIVSDGQKLVTQMQYYKNIYAKTERGRIPRFEWMGRISPWTITHWMELPPPPL